MSTPSTAAPLPHLRIHRLRIGHPDQALIARDWSADIGPGVALVHGDTGSGKSTLIRVLAGDAPALGGTVALPHASLPSDRATWRRQVFHVDPGTEAFHEMSVQQCVAALTEGDAGFDAERWQALALAFGLEPHLEKKLLMLSTGSRRKVWLATALASGRALVLLDEPTAALDAGSVRALQAALAEAARDTRRLVLVASSDHWPDLPWQLNAPLPLG